MLPRKPLRAILLWLACALAARAFTVATYNVENYTLADRMADGVHRESYPKPESEKVALRRVVRAMNADLLALQEMGGPAFLAELQRDLRHDGLDAQTALAWLHDRSEPYFDLDREVLADDWYPPAPA